MRARDVMRRHRTTVASWTALGLVSGILVAYAVNADGYPVHKAELNDGGIWITNQSMGAVGRENVPVAQIDARVFDGKGEATRAGLDVIQDGSAVFSVDRDSGTIMPIDVTTATGLQDQRVTAGGHTALYGGRTLGMLDPGTGKLWATTVDPDTGTGSLSDLAGDARPLATVGASAVGAASRSGTLYAASSAGTLLTLRQASTAGGFAKPLTDTMSGKHTFTAMTVVGDTAVLLDAAGKLVSTDQTLAGVGREARLQQSGPHSDEVVVATPTALLAVPLEGGKPRTLTELGAQESIAAPVVMPGGCAFGAWAAGGTGTLATSCGAAKATTSTFKVSAGAQLVFRTNRNQVVLNDERSGETWTVADAAPQQIADWDSFRQETSKKADSNARKAASQTSQPPQAKDDELGARDGRTTVLNVLDNDLIASDGVLSVVDVKGIDNKAVQVRIAPDRQSVLATVSSRASGIAHFTYTIDDGGDARKSGQDDGEVTLHLRADAGSGKPTLRPHAEARAFPVTAGGVVEFAVTPDWRDLTYGDPVVVDSVKASGDLRVTTTALGLIRAEAPAGSKGGVQTVSYQVTTGGAKVDGTVKVDVLPAGTRTVAARAESDVVSGAAGSPITVRPLDNDIPGADGSDPGAELALAGRVSPAGGLTVETDLESGRVVVNGSTPGTYFLDYSAGFGAAARAAGRIRVDIAPPAKDSDTPVATPDNANVHGMSPTIIDVLANDYDPKGRMLVVQDAQPSGTSSQLEVAVVDGRWLRVDATDAAMTPASQSVTYTISNGVDDAQGSVSVTQRDALTGVANAPVAQVDRATVRAGDTASIPVLDNDTTPSGDAVGLVVPAAGRGGSTGQLTVLGSAPDSGAAYVSGRQVRFVAPEDLTGAADVEVQYVAENTGDPTAPTAVGLIKVHITAPPSDTNPNQAPAPRAIEGRVVQGDVVTLKLPPVGSDPDGDSVAVSGIESAPKLGRILSYGANSLSYQAFPDSHGTDEFRYTVTDRFGATGSATARVGVVRAGTPQAPLAVDDELTAAPGRTVTVDILANDMRARGTKVTVEPLVGAPSTVKLVSPTGPIEVVAPDDGRTTRVVYTITNGLAESRAVVAVTGKDGYNNPPVVGDIYAQPHAGATSVTVDALASAIDLDGPEDALQLVDVTAGAPSASTGSAGSDDGGAAKVPVPARPRVEGGKVVVAITGVAQVLAYKVKDGDGAVGAAALYVPARPTGAPYLKPGAEITVDPKGEVTKDLSDLVVDPEGDPVRLTVADTISASPATRLSVDAPDTTSLTVHATATEGPGAVTFEVSDRKELDDRTAHRAFISVPVQVGDPDPVVSCPTEAIEVPEGGVSRTVDVASVCHVWTADPADAKDLEFTADWSQKIPGVDVSTVDGGGLRFEASGDAHRGDIGVLDVGARGHDATGKLNVKVVALPPARMAPIRLDTQVGKLVSVDVASYVTSPLPAGSRHISVVDISAIGGASATASHEGSKVTLTPKKHTHGVMRYRVEVSDVGGSATSARPTVEGELQLAVVDRPDAPRAVQVGTELLSKTIALTWTTPDNNGERIDRYEVAYAGETFSCPGSPCRVTGLANGKDYSFTVRAHNAVGWSDPSPAVKGQADAFTGAVRNPRVLRARDHSLLVAWDAPAACDCSAVQKYQVSAPGMITLVSATQRQYNVQATNGEDTTVTIVPLNAKGMKEHTGPKNTVTGVAAGAPGAPAQPAVAGSNVAGGSQKAITVSWSPVAANGPGPVTYQVMRDSRVVCGWVSGTSCQDTNVTNDGTTYSYAVRARNAEATSSREAQVGGARFHVSPLSPTRSIEASAPPAAPVIRSITPTGKDGQATIAFTAGASHGATNTVTCTVGSCSWNGPRAGGADTMVVNGLPDGVSTEVALQACNGSKAADQRCTTGTPQPVTTYGPIGAITFDVWVDGQSVAWRGTVDPNGRPVQWTLSRQRPGYPKYQLNQDMTGNGPTTKQGSSIMTYGATYTYFWKISDGARGTTEIERTVTVPKPTNVPTIRQTQSSTTKSCNGTTCRRMLITATQFPKPSTCTAYEAGSNKVLGPSWTQDNATWYQTPVWVKAGVTAYAKCANGAITRNITYTG